MRGNKSQYYSQFDPRSIGGCVLWFDAADASSFTLSGSNITQWRDKIINLTLSNVGTATTRTTDVFPQGAVLFNGGYLISPSNVFTSTENINNINQFVVARRTQSVTYGLIAGVGFYTQNTKNSVYINANQVQIVARRGWTTNNTRYDGPLYANTINQTYIYSALTDYQASRYQLVDTGTANTATAFGGTGTTNGDTSLIYMGNNTYGEPFYGYIAEHLIYNVPLTTIQRQQIEGYLAQKWGLKANIPATHPFKSVPPVLRPFIPTDISECTVWVDAQDVGTLTFSNTSNVSVWTDKSGRGYNFSNDTVTMYPTYVSNGINGYPALQFLGNGSAGNVSNQRLDNSTVAMSNNYSVFAVARQNVSAPSWTGYNYIMRFPFTGDWGLFFGAHSSKNFTTFAGSGTGWYDVAANTPAVTLSGTTRILGMKTSNATMTPYYDGVTMTTKTGTNRTLTGMQIGDTNPLASNGQTWNGQIGEIIVYNQPVGDTARQQVEGYLARKWGLVGNLPATHLYRSLPALTTAFSPLTVSTCAVWLDAADRSTITLSGTTVTQWRDKSPTAATSTAATAATLNPNSLNGLDSILFDGAGNGYYYTALTVNSASHTIFYVARPTAFSGAAGYNYIVAFQDPAGGSPYIVFPQYRPDAAGQRGYITSFDGTAIDFQNSTLYDNAVANQVTLSVAVIRSGSQEVYRFGTLQRSNTQTLTSATSPYLYIGKYPQNAGYFFSGNLYEVVIFNATLTTTERQQVEGYLAHKWGLTGSLPVGHPYKLIKP